MPGPTLYNKNLRHALPLYLSEVLSSPLRSLGSSSVVALVRALTRTFACPTLLTKLSAARALFAESLELLRKVSKASPALFDNFVQKRVTLQDAPEVRFVGGDLVQGGADFLLVQYYKLFDERKVGKTVFIGTGF